MIKSFNDFVIEKKCSYKDNLYSVRDNGSVMKHSLPGKKPRPTDNTWTFGKRNLKTGYYEIATERVHRIVATAFHGEPPNKDYVVDHIDTNKLNNRPENLRWVTRLENILLNPITVKRIETVCGCSVEEFLENPSQFKDKFKEQDMSWMCNVTKEEGQNSLHRLLDWAKSDKMPSGGTLGIWIYERANLRLEIEETQDVVKSLTQNAVQRDWNKPSAFPCCPIKISKNPLEDYYNNLKEGVIFSRTQYYHTLIEQYAISNGGNLLWVLGRSGDSNPVKPYSLAEISFEGNLFVHTSLGTFFTKEGAEKALTLAQGLEWTGGETIDDYS